MRVSNGAFVRVPDDPMPNSIRPHIHFQQSRHLQIAIAASPERNEPFARTHPEVAERLDKVPRLRAVNRALTMNYRLG